MNIRRKFLSRHLASVSLNRVYSYKYIGNQWSDEQWAYIQYNVIDILMRAILIRNKVRLFLTSFRTNNISCSHTFLGTYKYVGESLDSEYCP